MAQREGLLFSPGLTFEELYLYLFFNELLFYSQVKIPLRSFYWLGKSQRKLLFGKNCNPILDRKCYVLCAFVCDTHINHPPPYEL